MTDHAPPPEPTPPEPTPPRPAAQPPAPLPALILGAAVCPDGPSPTLRRRTGHAAGLYHAGHVSHLIPCGGLGRHPPAEALMMRDLLIAAGVPPDRITPETAFTTTEQNIRLALPLLARLGPGRRLSSPTPRTCRGPC